MSDQLRVEHGNADPEWALVQLAIREHVSRDVFRYENMWAYYRNPLELVRHAGAASGGRGWYRSAQEVGLPTRIVGASDSRVLGGERGRREVVVENDIGWRVGAMVDFMFGSPVRIESLARDEKTRDAIEEVLESVWEESGGISLMQDMATLGHVFGHVDLLLRVDEEELVGSRIDDASQWLSIEPIDARRGVAVMSSSDYRRIDAYAVHVERDVVAESTTKNGKSRGLSKLKSRSPVRSAEVDEAARRRTQRLTELFTSEGWARFEDGVRVEGYAWGLMPGVLPIVHIQNMSQPFSYSGLGEVEALVGLQDELNTRLSDRASRVTMQSFKMYLAKGIEGFGGSSVGPGVVWSTDNPDAEIHSFGGDAHSPSEDSHIDEIREAMDKISGVPPVAGGVVKTKLGNLSSATALRITLMSLIAKTLRKRVGYGRGIEQVSRMVLDVLDGAGVLKTAVGDRGVRVIWGALPVVDEESVVAAGRAKIDLGVEPEVVLDELGFGDEDPGVV